MWSQNHGAPVVAALAVALLAAGAAQAQTVTGNQYVFGFDDPSEPFGLGPGTGIETDFSCDSCTVQIGTPDFPAVSGPNVLQVNSDFKIRTKPEIDISWPFFGAFVTGAAPVTATFYAYNPDTQLEDLLGTVQTSGNFQNEFIGFQNPGQGASLTLADFTSTEPFALDDVTLGLVDGPIGIPEPSAWAMLLTGFGGLGALMRRRRAGPCRVRLFA